MGNKQIYQASSSGAKEDCSPVPETYKILDSHNGDLMVVGGVKIDYGNFRISNNHPGTVRVNESSFVVPLTYDLIKKYTVGTEVEYIHIVRESGNAPGYVLTLNKCEVTAVKIDTSAGQYGGLSERLRGPHVLVCFSFKNVTTEEETYKLYKTTTK